MQELNHLWPHHALYKINFKSGITEGSRSRLFFKVNRLKISMSQFKKSGHFEKNHVTIKKSRVSMFFSDTIERVTNEKGYFEFKLTTLVALKKVTDLTFSITYFRNFVP